MKKKLSLPCVCKGSHRLPIYATEGSAGADVCALLAEPVILAPLERALIPTGLFFEIPVGYEIQVRPRSGLAMKEGITVCNTPGTIDSDYRGELKVLLINLGNRSFTIEDGMRIAQIVAAPVVQVIFDPVDQLGSTLRGSGGFGHTGLCHADESKVPL